MTSRFPDFSPPPRYSTASGEPLVATQAQGEVYEKILTRQSLFLAGHAHFFASKGTIPADQRARLR